MSSWGRGPASLCRNTGPVPKECRVKNLCIGDKGSKSPVRTLNRFPVRPRKTNLSPSLSRSVFRPPLFPCGLTPDGPSTGRRRQRKETTRERTERYPESSYSESVGHRVHGLSLDSWSGSTWDPFGRTHRPQSPPLSTSTNNSRCDTYRFHLS